MELAPALAMVPVQLPPAPAVATFMPGGSVSVKVLVRMAATSLELPNVIVIWLVAPLVIVDGEKVMLEITGGLAVCASAGSAWARSSTAQASGAE
jgi:hypothetical protein